jgi:hypothetical protein
MMIDLNDIKADIIPSIHDGDFAFILAVPCKEHLHILIHKPYHYALVIDIL